ncbi:hypothetical protein AcW1_001833 [Taiwanofungus camphoratus]|nr:hypothetical protein AcV5_000117 [Antrodia cinnamomea]KAI0945665.1 hypothetical protein AcW1_001833 [Antrodia cinnamomea]
MELFDEAGRAVVPTTVGMPQFVNVTGDQNSTVSNDVWTSVTELLPYLSLVDYERTIGLYKGTLYDVPKSGLGNVSVGAVAANVSCGFLPNITALGTQDINIWDMNVSIQWDVQAWWRQPTANFGLLFNLHTILWPGVIQQVAYLDAGTTPMMPREMIFVLTTNISDSNGDLNSTIPLPSDHAMCIVMNDVKTCVESLSVIGCTLSWLNQTAIVNAQEGALASVQPSGEKSSSVWNLWTPKTPSNTFFDPQVDTWGNMLANSAFSSTVIDGFSVANSTDPGSFSAVYGYLTEQYLLKELGMSPNTSSNIMLHQIENALANLTAALYWASANLLPPNTTQAYVSLLSGATVAAQTASRLNLNLLPIAVGFGCSTVLLFLAVQFTHGMNESTPRIGSIGVLQLIWLTHEQPAFQELVATVNQPTTENLRSVGMLKIGIAQQNRPNGYAD